MKCLTFALGLAVSVGLAFGQAPDNTKTNKRDRDPSAQQTTPQNATATKGDVDTLKNIRKAITSQKDLSTYAHNVKVTVKDGVATLRGPVRTAEERDRIGDLAKQNGATSVVNELEVAPEKK